MIKNNCSHTNIYDKKTDSPFEVIIILLIFSLQ